MVAGKQVTGATEAGLHLVDHQDDAVTSSQRGHTGQEAGGRHDEAALALQRLDHDGRDIARADQRQQVLERSKSLGRAVLRTGGPAQRIGIRRPVHLAGEGAEPGLVRDLLGGHRHGQQAAPVEGVLEDHHVRAAGGRPGDLHGVLHGLGTGGEQGRTLRVGAGGEPVETLGDVDIPLVSGHQEAGVTEPGGLLLHPGDDLGGAGADAGDGDSGRQVDEVVAVDVDDDAPAGPLHEDRKAGAKPARDRALTALLEGS